MSVTQSLIHEDATDRMLVTQVLQGIEFWFNYLEDLVANEIIDQDTSDEW